MELKALANRISALVSGCIILGIGALIYVFLHRDPPQNSAHLLETYPNFCGTQRRELTGTAEKGRTIFNSYCAACHKLEVKSTGPALGKIDSVVYWKWMVPAKRKIDTTKLDRLNIDFHQNLATVALDSSDAKDLLEYITAK